MSHITVSASTTHLALSLSISASDRDSCNIIMLQTGAIYLATTNIARDTFSVCQVLGRAFKQYRNEKRRFCLRCKDCGQADCFTVEARSVLIEGSTQWQIGKLNLSFHCTPQKTKGRKRHYTTKQLLAWGVIPTAVSFVPTTAGGRVGGGQVKQFGTMVKHSDGVALKRTQLSDILKQKKSSTTEVQIQQFALLQSYSELDLKQEVDAIERRKPKFAPPISAYVLDSEWQSLDGIEMPVFVRLMYTTGYCKYYWKQKGKWPMCELDMCHIKVTFGGHISLLTHSTANGQNKILAFGIHTRENKEEWGHFFNFCNLHYPGIRHLVNDQDKGLKSIELHAKMKTPTPTLTTSHCILHIVRNELVARNNAGAGSFNVTKAGGETVQALATKLAKACSPELYTFFLNRLREGNPFTADFFHSRREIFSSAFYLGQIKGHMHVFSLRGPVPPQARRGKVHSNTAETSNSNGGINKYRTMPILDMVKGIATKMSTQHFKVHDMILRRLDSKIQVLCCSYITLTLHISFTRRVKLQKHKKQMDIYLQHTQGR